MTGPEVPQGVAGRPVSWSSFGTPGEQTSVGQEAPICDQAVARQ